MNTLPCSPSFFIWFHISHFYRSKITEEGGVLMVQNVPSRVMIPPKALPTCTEVTCSLWNLKILSPSLGRNEALVSSVMELACGSLPGTEKRYEFNVKVKLALFHSASDIKGYELVIKELIDEKTNDWRDLETRWAWTPSGRGYVGNLQGTAILPQTTWLLSLHETTNNFDCIKRYTGFVFLSCRLSLWLKLVVF